MFNRKHYLASLLTCLLFATLTVSAQLPSKSSIAKVRGQSLQGGQVVAALKPLAIGDPIPNIELTMMNYKKSTARIADFRGKLILLDFWATWCGACIASFPKLDQLQKEFGDRLQVILVNSAPSGDNIDKIKQFIKKRELVQKKPFTILPIAAEDTVAVQLFPYLEVPHYVWISPAGIVKAITSSDEVTSTNIANVLSGQDIQLFQKRDFFTDKISKFDEDLIINDELMHYSFLKKGRLEGWGTVNSVRSVKVNGSRSALRGILMRNVPLLDMYRTAIQLKIEYSPLWHNRKREILDVTDSASILKPEAREADEWEKENLYSYDLVFPVDQASRIYEYIIDDLNKFSGFIGKVEKRKTRCWAIVVSDTTKFLKRDSKQFLNAIGQTHEGNRITLQNSTVSYLTREINLYTKIEVPVVDYTNNAPILIDIKIELMDTDIESLRRKVKNYGLDVIALEQEELDMLVIRKK